MNILVTGGSGYIASKLIPKLLGNKVDSLDSKYPNREIAALLNRSFELDITRNIRLPIDYKYDLIIHTVSTFNSSKDIAMNVNYNGTVNVLDMAMKHGSEFVLLSTCGVLNDLDDSWYTVSKRQAERSLSGYDKSKIVRLASVYGYAPVMNYVGLVNQLVFSTCIRRGIEVRGLNEYRPIVHINDAVTAILQAEGKVTNVATANVKKQEIVDAILRNISFPIHVDCTTSDKDGYKVEPLTKGSVSLDDGISELVKEIA